MFLEIKRVLTTTWSRGRGRNVLEFIVLPFLVAYIMVTAFLARSDPGAQGEAFLFFGTLYAFWCGLFGACQAFNGEVNSGEWSYWMLGMNRSVVKHYAAYLAVTFVFALIQVMLSLVFVWFMWQVGIWVQSIAYIFIAHGDGGTFVEQVGSMLEGGSAFNLQGLQAIMNYVNHKEGETNWLWFGFCLQYYSVGVAAAVASGAVIGLLLSALCSTPQISLSAAVFLIVACCICSHTGILGFGSNSKSEREFAPISLIFGQQGREFQSADDYERVSEKEKVQTRYKDGGMVEQMSFLLPQRFFFNIARIPCLELKASLRQDNDCLYWYDPGRLYEHSHNMIGLCKCPACLGLVRVDKDDQDNYNVIEGTGTPIPFEHHWLSAGNTASKWKENVFGRGIVDGGSGKFKTAMAENKGGVQSLFALCRKMASGEILALLVWGVIYLSITLILLKRRRMFNELR